MSEPIFFLTIDHVLAIHHRIIKEFGGNTTLRDRGLLASAVAMPAASFDGEYLHESIAAKAAAYLFHLCNNHAFVDGNKRTALVSAEMFIQLNGRRLDVKNAEIEALTLGVAKGEIAKGAVTDFFTQHVTGE